VYLASPLPSPLLVTLPSPLFVILSGAKNPRILLFSCHPSPQAEDLLLSLLLLLGLERGFSCSDS